MKQESQVAKNLKVGDILKIDNPYGYGFQKAIITKIEPKPKEYWINKYDKFKESEDLHISYEWKGVGFYTTKNKFKEVIIFTK